LSLYRTACDPFFGMCNACLKCPCNSPGCKNCLNGLNTDCFDPICGVNGCIGISKPLCGCCGNCALCWYAGCCEYCYIADLSVAVDGDTNGERWKDVAYPLVFWYVISQIFLNIGNALGAGSTGKQLCDTVAQIIEFLLYVSATVMFGKAATKIAQAKSQPYEAIECCTNCGFSLGCDDCGFSCAITPMCCLTYWCCMPCHYVQVGRVMEDDPGMIQTVMNSRPQECGECCDCWSRMEMGGTAVNNASAPPQGTAMAP